MLVDERRDGASHVLKGEQESGFKSVTVGERERDIGR